jgi:hypothetical protein
MSSGADGPERRRCPCPCGEWFTPTRSTQIHATPACRTRKCRAKRARRAARRYAGVTTPRPPTRYAVVQIKGSVIEVLGFDVGKSRKAVERAFGIVDRSDLGAVAGRHLPEVV